MSFQNNAPIIQKVYDFYRSFYEQADNFPTKSREVLIKKIELLLIELLELLFAAGLSPVNAKTQYLNKASVKLDFLKMLIGLIYELRIINQPKYLALESQLQEIGKMLGGWIRSLKA